MKSKKSILSSSNYTRMRISEISLGEVNEFISFHIQQRDFQLQLQSVE